MNAASTWNGGDVPALVADEVRLAVDEEELAVLVARPRSPVWYQRLLHARTVASGSWK